MTTSSAGFSSLRTPKNIKMSMSRRVSEIPSIFGFNLVKNENYLLDPYSEALWGGGGQTLVQKFMLQILYNSGGFLAI